MFNVLKNEGKKRFCSLSGAQLIFRFSHWSPERRFNKTDTQQNKQRGTTANRERLCWERGSTV